MLRLLIIIVLPAFIHASSGIPRIQSLEYSDVQIQEQRKETAENLRRIASGEIPSLRFRLYRLKKEDNFFTVMAKTMLDHDTLSTVNNLETLWSHSPGDEWIIPNARGVAMRGDVAEIALKYKVPLSAVFSVPGHPGFYFIAGAKLAVEQKAFLNLTAFIRPVSGKVTSPFGKRADPFTHKEKFHKGIDIACEIGTPVVAAASGTIEFVGWKSGYGKTVIIDHGNGYKTLYGHLSNYSIAKGAKVKQGSKIALSGDTGRSTGPHLHFEVRKGGTPQRPLFAEHGS